MIRLILEGVEALKVLDSIFSAGSSRLSNGEAPFAYMVKTWKGYGETHIANSPSTVSLSLQKTQAGTVEEMATGNTLATLRLSQILSRVTFISFIMTSERQIRWLQDIRLCVTRRSGRGTRGNQAGLQGQEKPFHSSTSKEWKGVCKTAIHILHMKFDTGNNFSKIVEFSNFETV